MNERSAPEPIRLERWTVTAGSNSTSRAAVVLSGGGRDWQASAEGTGAIHALFTAVDAALAAILGGQPRLVGYEVHALSEGTDAEGRATVRVAPPTGATGARAEGEFGGAASSQSIIAASVEAYVQALNALLAAESWAGAPEEAASAHGGAPTHERHAPVEVDADAEPIDATEWFNR
jgi:2-isopropylmalate synthase